MKLNVESTMPLAEDLNHMKTSLGELLKTSGAQTDPVVATAHFIDSDDSLSMDSMKHDDQTSEKALSSLQTRIMKTLKELKEETELPEEADPKKKFDTKWKPEPLEEAQPLTKPSFVMASCKYRQNRLELADRLKVFNLNFSTSPKLCEDMMQEKKLDVKLKQLSRGLPVQIVLGKPKDKKNKGKKSVDN